MSEIKTKFINDPEQVTPELLEGLVLAYPEQVKLAAENIIVRANPKSEDKVAIVTLGGSGHEPALSGFVGEGMLDCSVVGDIFAAPGAQRLFQALQLMKREAGILLVVLNHSGDVMSANMACQLAERAGIKVKQVLTHDDISAGIDADINDRRGLAGCVPLYKILGAASEEGKSLDELVEIAERFNKNLATLAVAMRSCTHPQNGATITDLPAGIMEIGMGQHGEGGGGQKPLVEKQHVLQSPDPHHSAGRRHHQKRQHRPYPLLHTLFLIFSLFSLPARPQKRLPAASAAKEARETASIHRQRPLS